MACEFVYDGVAVGAPSARTWRADLKNSFLFVYSVAAIVIVIDHGIPLARCGFNKIAVEVVLVNWLSLEFAMRCPYHCQVLFFSDRRSLIWSAILA